MGRRGPAKDWKSHVPDSDPPAGSGKPLANPDTQGVAVAPPPVLTDPPGAMMNVYTIPPPLRLPDPGLATFSAMPPVPPSFLAAAKALLRLWERDVEPKIGRTKEGNAMREEIRKVEGGA